MKGLPKFWTRLFERFCNDSFYEELQGDLEERFYFNLEEKGVKKAQRIYRSEIIKMLRPSVIRKVKHQKLNNTAMFKNYTLVAFRSLSRNKLFSAINIVGLSISMAVGLLAITFLNEARLYDKFHTNEDRIYRIINTLYEGQEEPGHYATTSPKTGQILTSDYESYEKLVTIYKNFSGDAKKGGNIIPLKGLYASKDFFDIFTFPMLYGNPSQSLVEPYSIVLTEESALKLFNRTDVVGEIVQWNESESYTVTGVVKNPPNASHISFQAIASFTTMEQKNRENTYLMHWQNMWNSHVYVLMPEGVGNESLKANLKQIEDKENIYGTDFKVNMELQSMDDIFPSRHLNNQLGARMEIGKINSIIILALIVLFSACFNYTNLSIARTIKRSKEVGVRKVVGAKKRQILIQFILEAIIISLIALIIAFFIFKLLKPLFLAVDGNIQRFITLDLTPQVYVYFLIFAVLIGVFAGLLPSAILSKLKPSTILKSNSGLNKMKGMSIRKVLSGLQFILSMAFVIMISLTYKQYSHVLNFDLGFTTDQVLNIKLQGNDKQTLINSIGQLPEVTQISMSSAMPSVGGMWFDRGKYLEGNDSTGLYNLHVSPEYLENLGHELLAGSTFSKELGHNQVIINEQTLKRFSIDDPIDAIGQHIRIQGKIRNIVGVISDFHYATLDNNIEPFVFLSNPDQFNLLNLKVKSGNWKEALEKIEGKWVQIDPTHPLEARFYDEQIESAYSDLSGSLKTLGALAIISISISMLGLLGMTIYTTESRNKELTIRKILGASGWSLTALLSKSFMLLFAISVLVAIPAAIYAFYQLIASKMLYVIDVGVFEIGSGILFILLLAIMSIGSQTFKAIKANPVKHLRNE